MVAFLSDLGASAARCLRLCSRVRTTNCCSGPGIGTRAKSFPREAEAAKIYSRENTRIQGAPPTGKKLFKPYPNLLCERSGYYGLPDPNIYERKCTSLSSCLQHWKADLCPKPKPDIFVYSLDDNLRKCFVAYSLEEDGIISPKYYIYPPSFLAKEYKGLLSALECWDLESNFYPYVPWKFDLWVMRDGSWTRESVIETRAVKEPLWFSLDGKLLYFTSLTDELVVFDRDTGKLKYLGVNWPNTSITRPMMIPFYESFVQLN
ncbi:unnamed protein product [Cuscuta campestris]|uniref:F-box associated domain-containing protein n=1 Tax=Cuscuta campestris TaxID=132261 RepID=A0A484K6U9_9ASTE|nr:unnamed protein product [Cuscuta campestris]